MDPLSVVASIAGLLSAAGAVTKALAPYVAAARATPKVAVQVHSEIQSITIILSALQGLAQNLGSVPVQRAALIQVDHVVAVLTDGVLIFSELEAVAKTLDSLGDLSVSITRLALRSRLQWARKESEFTSLLARLQGFKSSASLILNILQSDSAIRAEESRTDLTNNVNHLLESSRDIARRLMTLEDNLNVMSIVSKRRSVAVSLKLGHAEDDETKRFLKRFSLKEDATISQLLTSPSTIPVPEHTIASGFDFKLSPAPDSPSTLPTITSGFDFEQDLEASRAYRRAQRETMDFSFRSSVAWSNGMSVFSGLTLGDVSVMSVIALPICAADISNAHHYTFGNREATVPQASPTKPEVHASVTTVNSLVYECLEITIHLSHICGSTPTDVFGHEGLYSSQEHPFVALRRIFHVSRETPFSMLFKVLEARLDLEQEAIERRPRRDRKQPPELAQTPDRGLLAVVQTISERMCLTVDDTVEFDVLLCSREVGFLRALDFIKAVLTAVTSELAAPIEPNRLHNLIRQKRGYFGRSPLSDVVVGDFLAQERLFFHQLEDLPTVEKQMKILNLLVEERLSAIFTPLYEFMHIQLKFLLDIERNLLLPPQSQSWSIAFFDWSENTELLGKLIANETRTKWILRARLGSNEDSGGKCRHSPQVDAIAACFNLVSLPALSMLGHLEFLESLEEHIDKSDTSRRADISESRKILIRAHNEISRIVKQEDLSEEFSRLRRGMADWKRLDINQFGELLMYDANVGLLDILMPHRHVTKPHSPCRMYTFEKILIFADETAGRRESLRAQDLMETPKILQLKGRILLSNIKAIVRSEPTKWSSGASDSACLVVHSVESGLDAFELKFMTPSKMRTWTEELWAAIQTPQHSSTATSAQQQLSYETNDVSTMPVTYPNAWKNTLLLRGYKSYE